MAPQRFAEYLAGYGRADGDGTVVDLDTADLLGTRPDTQPQS